MHIYVENDSALPSVFHITEKMVRESLPETLLDARISVRKSDQLDEGLLQISDVFVGSGFDTEIIAKHGKRLKVIHCLTAGVEAYAPLDWIPEGAAFTNSSGVQADKSAMFGPMAILMLNERIPKYATDQRRRIWDPTFSTNVRGKTAAFCGFGAIGQAIASKLRDLGMSVIAIRRSGEKHPDADETYGPERLAEVLPRSDFLVICCPLTEQTRGLIGEGELNLLPRGAAVLNIGRGPVVDNRALTAALTNEHLSGAIVDVFDPEPLPDESSLWNVPNLMILPHISCDDPHGYIDRCLSILSQNLDRLIRGEALRNVVDPVRGY